MKIFSILLGAGFSRDAFIPDRNVINQKLKNIKYEEFNISGVGIAYFTNSNDQNAKWQSINERKFIEFFISKYNLINNEFDYEEFYDYAIELYKNHETSQELVNIYQSFKATVSQFYPDQLNAISILIRTIDQLIDSLLYFNGNVFDTGIINKYSGFLKLIDYLVANDYQVNIFTLNHDLLLEKLLTPSSYNYEFADGFQFEKTPFYIKQQGFQFRIKFYNKIFDQKVNIFKLHGSIDQFKINYSLPYDMVKIPKQLNHLNLYREKENGTGTFDIENIWTLYKPDFLSGNENKIQRYSSHQYYKDVFQEFEVSLKDSRILMCIGYGLGDIEINRKIHQNFNSEKGKVLIVKPSKGSENFYLDENYHHYGIGKGAADIKLDLIKIFLE